MITREQLPNDTFELKGIVCQLLDVVEEQRTLIANLNQRVEVQLSKNEEQYQHIAAQSQQIAIQSQQIITQSQQMEVQSQKIEEQSQRIDQLTDQVNVLTRYKFGKRSEKVKEEKPKPSNEGGSQDGYGRKKGHGRKPFPPHLPRRQVHYQLTASERVCECCSGFLSKMGEQMSEQLEIIPAKVYVIQHIRHKYACRKCQDKVVIAKMPDQPIDKGKAGPGVLAEVMVNKYQDHLPLYRQSQRFARLGIELSRSTLCGWVMQSAKLLAPLVDAMKDRALIPSRHLFSDDTTIRTLQEEGGVKTGRFWIYTSKGRGPYPACTVYQYTPTRESAGPLNFLKDFEGYFQADAYSGYDCLFEKDEEGKASVIEIACWAHARRKFHEIARVSTKEGLAHEALKFIQELYKIEWEIKENALKSREVKKWRQKHAPPILEAFHKWLKEQKERVLPKSALAGAINYTLNHWEAFNSYLLDGALEIDNNRSERGMRPLAIGRKNYLFVGSEFGGESAAVIYSLLATCQQHGVNPLAYLRDVLARLPNHLNSKIDELLPYNWKPMTEEASLELYFEKAA